MYFLRIAALFFGLAALLSFAGCQVKTAGNITTSIGIYQ